ncbi:MAG TPA: zinc ribbon domain-containing protein [Euryarchaeota archaeon]|nr:zinc ribbon domain-containing protein [Euryarchaeota archaeon]
MDSTERTALFIIILIIFFIVLLIEFKFIRRKDIKRRIPTVSMEKDRAFNALHTSKAVRNKLKTEGYDVLKAEYMIDKADSAFASRQYAVCIDLCDKAKGELIRCRREGAVFADRDQLDDSDKVEHHNRPERPRDEMKEVVRTGGGLFLQARFELNAARDELDKFEGSAEERDSATELISDAERLFDSGEYQKALSASFKARKIISGEVEPDLDAQEARPGGKSCPSCGEKISEGDQFCFACGCALKERKCSSCGAEMRGSDRFCRKCGAKN